MSGIKEFPVPVCTEIKRYVLDGDWNVIDVVMSFKREERVGGRGD